MASISSSCLQFFRCAKRNSFEQSPAVILAMPFEALTHADRAFEGITGGHRDEFSAADASAAGCASTPANVEDGRPSSRARSSVEADCADANRTGCPAARAQTPPVASRTPRALIARPQTDVAAASGSDTARAPLPTPRERHSRHSARATPDTARAPLPRRREVQMIAPAGTNGVYRTNQYQLKGDDHRRGRRDRRGRSGGIRPASRCDAARRPRTEHMNPPRLELIHVFGPGRLRQRPAVQAVGRILTSANSACSAVDFVAGSESVETIH